MLQVRLGAVVAALTVVMSGQGLAGGPPGPLKDWPCPVPFADHLAAEAVWPGALPAPLPETGAWQADPRAKTLVEFIAGTENSARAGTQFIDDDVVRKGRLTPALAMLVLSGTVERINRIRDFLIEGIHSNVVRSHILAGAVAENDAHLAQAKEDEAPGIRKARLANLRALDDAGDGAELLCHRYAYDESKAKELAAALQRRTE